MQLENLLTEEEFLNGILPSDIASKFPDPVERSDAISQILVRLKADLIPCVSRNLHLARGEYPKSLSHFTGVYGFHWRATHSGFEEDRFWRTNDLVLDIHDHPHIASDTYSFIEVRLDRDCLTSVLPSVIERLNAVAAKSKIDSGKHPGGRPRNPQWDDLWAEMCRLILEEDFMPNSQADIENAMLQWASDHDVAIGATAVKDPARKLFNVLHKKVRN